METDCDGSVQVCPRCYLVFDASEFSQHRCVKNQKNDGQSAQNGKTGAKSGENEGQRGNKDAQDGENNGQFDNMDFKITVNEEYSAGSSNDDDEDVGDEECSEDVKPLVCQLCFLVFNEESLYNKHMEEQHGKSEANSGLAPAAQGTSDTKPQADFHPIAIKSEKSETAFEGTFECHICKLLFTTTEEFNEHMLSHAQKNVLGGKKTTVKFKVKLNSAAVSPNVEFTRYGCSECGKVFDSKIEYQAHKATHPTSQLAQPMVAQNYLQSPASIAAQEPPLKVVKLPADSIAHIIQHKTASMSQVATSLPTRNPTIAHGGQRYEVFVMSDNKIVMHPVTDNRKGTFHCHICQTRYSLKSDLQAHLQTHKDSLLPCGRCGVMYSDPEKLNRHIEMDHGETTAKNLLRPEVKIKIAPAALKAKNLHNMVGQSCKKCRQVFLTKKSLDIHMTQEHRGDLFCCDQCPQFFSSQFYLNRHKLYAHDVNHICKLCHLSFTSFIEFNDHMAKHREREEKRRALSNFECDVCGKVFKKWGYLHLHKRWHKSVKKNKFKCKRCKVDCGSKEYLQMHEEWKHPELFVSEEEVEEGESDKEEERALDEKKEVLVVKEEVMDEIKEALDEKKETMDEKRETLDEKKKAMDEQKKAMDEKKKAMDEKKKAMDEKKKAMDENPDKLHACAQCPETFPTMQDLAVHMSDNHVLKCGTCKHVIGSKGYLVSHMISHGSINPAKCKYCHLYYPGGQKRDEHIRSEHWDEAVMETSSASDNGSEISSNSGKSASGQKKDISANKISGVRGISHFCKKCGEAFRNKEGLQKHLATSVKCALNDGSSSSGESDDEIIEEDEITGVEEHLTCAICHRTFKTTLGLATHMRQHNNAFQLKGTSKNVARKEDDLDPEVDLGVDLEDGQITGKRKSSQGETEATVSKRSKHEVAQNESDIEDKNAQSEDMDEIISEEDPVENTQNESAQIPFETAPKIDPVEIVPKMGALETAPQTDQSIATPEAPSSFQCPHCKVKFVSQKLLDEHIENHGFNKPFKCEDCGRGFDTSENLSRHVTSHLLADFYPCEKCDKVFPKRAQYSSHVKTHIPKPKVKTHKFQCETCSVVYSSSVLLYTHRVNQHNAQTQFMCELCGRFFVNETVMGKHKANCGKKK